MAEGFGSGDGLQGRRVEGARGVKCDEGMDDTHLYIDEAGNFDFGPNGTRWLILTCVNVPWDNQRIARLAELRHELMTAGLDLEYFHASEDNREVRRQFIETFADLLLPGSIRTCPLLKRNIPVELRAPEKLYPTYIGPLVQAHIGANHRRAFIFSDNLPLSRKRHGLEKAVATELSGKSSNLSSYKFMHHASKSNFDLQIADYCCWAIWRAFTRGDDWAMRRLGPAIARSDESNDRLGYPDGRDPWSLVTEAEPFPRTFRSTT